MRIESTITFADGSSGFGARALTQFIESACKASRVNGSINVLIARSPQIRKLNFRFRGKDTATDVLSFPAPPLANGFAGDIAISRDIATANARALGHSVADEIRILILHGILHLAGYDHENDRGEMKRKEAALRRELGLPMALIERSSVSASSSAVGRRSSAKLRSSSGSSRRPKRT